jgi:hypothetical protein
VSELDLHFNPGDLMQLELVSNDRHQNYAAKVIGFLRGQSLLATTPMNRGKSILVREGQTFTARMMVGYQHCRIYSPHDTLTYCPLPLSASG